MPGSKRRVSFERLTDWVEGRLSEEEARAVEEQVLVGDSATLADVAWLRALAKIREDTVIASPEVRDTLIVSSDRVEISIPQVDLRHER